MALPAAAAPVSSMSFEMAAAAATSGAETFIVASAARGVAGFDFFPEATFAASLSGDFVAARFCGFALPAAARDFEIVEDVLGLGLAFAAALDLGAAFTFFRLTDLGPARRADAAPAPAEVETGMSDWHFHECHA